MQGAFSGRKQDRKRSFGESLDVRERNGHFRYAQERSKIVTRVYVGKDKKERQVKWGEVYE